MTCTPWKEIYTEALTATKAEKNLETIWHQRLEHPHSSTLSFLNSNKLIDVSSWNKKVSVCTSCQMRKSYKLPFQVSNKREIEQLIKIHCDLWGAAPIASSQGIKYYVIFVDDCTRFTWIYPIKKKSEFLANFVTFHKLVENQFSRKIKVFQCDGGGEFNSLEFINNLS